MTILLAWVVAIAQNIVAAVIYDRFRAGAARRGEPATTVGAASVAARSASAPDVSSADRDVEFFPEKHGWLRRHLTVFLGFSLLFVTLYVALVLPFGIRVFRYPGTTPSNARVLGPVLPSMSLTAPSEVFQAWGVWRVVVLYLLVLPLLLAAVRSTAAARVRGAWTKEARAGWRMDLAVWIGGALVFSALAVSTFAFWPVTPLAAGLYAALGLGLLAALYQWKP